MDPTRSWAWVLQWVSAECSLYQAAQAKAKAHVQIFVARCCRKEGRARGKAVESQRRICEGRWLRGAERRKRKWWRKWWQLRAAKVVFVSNQILQVFENYFVQLKRISLNSCSQPLCSNFELCKIKMEKIKLRSGREWSGAAERRWTWVRFHLLFRVIQFEIPNFDHWVTVVSVVTFKFVKTQLTWLSSRHLVSAAIIHDFNFASC